MAKHGSQTLDIWCVVEHRRRGWAERIHACRAICCRSFAALSAAPWSRPCSGTALPATCSSNPMLQAPALYSLAGTPQGTIAADMCRRMTSGMYPGRVHP